MVKEIIGLKIVRYRVLGTNIKTNCRFITLRDTETTLKSYYVENDYSHNVEEVTKEQGNQLYQNYISGMYGKLLGVKKVL